MTKTEQMKFEAKMEKIYGDDEVSHTLHMLLELNSAELIFLRYFFEKQLGRKFPDTEDIVKYMKQVLEDDFNGLVAELGLATIVEKGMRGDKDFLKFAKETMKDVNNANNS